MNIYIGYHNKFENGKYVILATTQSKAVAMFIAQSYKDAYKRAGIDTIIVLYNEIELDELPEGWKYAD